MTDEMHGFAWLLESAPWRIEQDPNYTDLPMPPRSRKPPFPTRTMEDRAKAFIAEGLCPCCKVAAPDGVCDICGWQLGADRSRTPQPVLAEVPDMPVPLEEYAPAEVDAA